MNSSPVTSLLNAPVKEAQETVSTKAKPEKEFSKILDEKTNEQDAKQNQNDKIKEEIRSRRTGEFERQFNPLQRFIYDLACHDPAIWSVADRQQYHLENNPGKALNIFTALSDSGLSGRALSKSQPVPLLHLQLKEERISSQDSAGSQLSAQAQNILSGRRSAFSDIKTSLQEITNGNRVSENQIVESLIRQIAIRKLNQGSEVRLTLNPQALGEVKLRLFLQKNELTARFETADSSVTELLSNHIGELNQALQKQGLNVKTLDVATQNSIREERYAYV